MGSEMCIRDRLFDLPDEIILLGLKFNNPGVPVIAEMLLKATARQEK